MDLPGFLKHNVRNAGRKQKRSHAAYEALLARRNHDQGIARAFRLGIRFATAYLAEHNKCPVCGAPWTEHGCG